MSNQQKNPTEDENIPNTQNKKPQTEKKKLSGDDIFKIVDIYPDAKSLLLFKQKPVSEIIEKCMFFLDTNVLLVPFGLDGAAFDEINKIYVKLADERRLLIPAQVIREFYNIRSSKLAAVAQKLNSSAEKLTGNILDRNITILKGDSKYQEISEISKSIEEQNRNLKKRILEIIEKLKSGLGNDRISLSYSDVLTDCIVDITYSASERTALVDDSERRARLSIAPGFQDKQKPDGGIGDLIIWKTILKEGKERKLDCIFVTNEEKPDWWVKTHGPFQPRPELIEEYRRITEGRTVHLMPLSELLSIFDASDNAIEKVKKIEEENNEIAARKSRFNGYSIGELEVFQGETRSDIDRNRMEYRRLYDDISNRIPYENPGASQPLLDLEHAIEYLHHEYNEIQYEIDRLNALKQKAPLPARGREK